MGHSYSRYHDNSSPSMFPLSFDRSIYRKSERHYDRVGVRRGKKASGGQDIVNLLETTIIPSTEGRIIELYPGLEPIVYFPGKMEYFDIIPTSQLVDRAISENRPMVRMVHIDHVGKRVSDLPENTFTMILNRSDNGLINLVYHLQSVARLLVEGGFYVIVVHDSRKQKIASIADILDQYTNNKRSLGLDIERCLCTKRHLSMKKMNTKIKSVWHQHDSTTNTNRWTPASFARMVDTLYTLEVVDLKVHRVYETLRPETKFTIVVQKAMEQRTLLPPVRASFHNTGWPWVIQHLVPRDIVLIHVVEWYFKYSDNIMAIKRPWCGIFHVPMGSHIPDYGNMSSMYTSPEFIASLPYCKGAICTSQTLSDNLCPHLPDTVPRKVIFHPMPEPDIKFSFSAFEENHEKKLVQIGNYLRNIKSFYDIDTPFTRIWLPGLETREIKKRLAGLKLQPENNFIVPRVPKQKYYELMSSNIVFLHLIDASANNAVLECLMSHTPVIVNRLPAIEEYLGKEYPLFYDDIAEVRALQSMENILAAHSYLCDRDKSMFHIDLFLSKLNEFLDDKNV